MKFISPMPLARERSRFHFAAVLLALSCQVVAGVNKVAQWSAPATSYRGMPFHEAIPQCRDFEFRLGASLSLCALPPSRLTADRGKPWQTLTALQLMIGDAEKVGRPCLRLLLSAHPSPAVLLCSRDVRGYRARWRQFAEKASKQVADHRRALTRPLTIRGSGRGAVRN